MTAATAKACVVWPDGKDWLLVENGVKWWFPSSASGVPRRRSSGRGSRFRRREGSREGRRPPRSSRRGPSPRGRRLHSCRGRPRSTRSEALDRRGKLVAARSAAPLRGLLDRRIEEDAGQDDCGASDAELQPVLAVPPGGARRTPFASRRASRPVSFSEKSGGSGGAGSGAVVPAGAGVSPPRGGSQAIPPGEARRGQAR